MNKAQSHGSDQDHQGIVQRREQSRQSEVLSAGQQYDLRQEITEETACNGTHDECGNTAERHQPKQMTAHSFWTVLSVDDHACNKHEKSISHIGHHNAVEQNKKRRHQRVGIHIVICGQCIHLRDHIERSCKPVVFQFDRNLRILFFCWICSIPGTVMLLQIGFDIFQSVSRNPAFKEEHGVIGEKAFSVFVLFCLCTQLIRIQAECIPLWCLLSNFLFQRFLMAVDFTQLFCQLSNVFLCRTGKIAEDRDTKVKGTKDFLNLFIVGFIEHQEVVFLLFISTDLIDLCRNIRGFQRGSYGTGIGIAGTYAQTKCRMCRSLEIQRYIQREPRFQCCLIGQNSSLLRLQFCNLLQ